MYHTLRTIHLLCGAFALPMLLIYGASAVQMAHTKWFSLTPVISESTVQLSSDYSDSRLLARELMTQGNVRGEINSVEETLSGSQCGSLCPVLCTKYIMIAPLRW